MSNTDWAASGALHHTQSHLLTRVDRFDLAFPIERVVSVHEAPLVLSVAGAQPTILGAVNLRGIAVPVADIRRALRLQPKTIEHDDRLLIVRSFNRHIGVVVDAVLTLVNVPPGVLQGPDPLFGDLAINAQVVTGIVAAPDLCAVVDPDGLVLPDPWTPEFEEEILATDVPSDHPLAARTAALAQSTASQEIAGTDAAVFVLNGQRYAVPIGSVVEFFSDAPYSAIPFVSGMFAGLVNRRGEALALYDVRPLLGLSPKELPPRVDGVVLSGSGYRVSVAVDAFEGLEVLPASTGGSGSRPGKYCISIHASERGAIQLLDVAALAAAPQLALSGEGSSS